MPEKSRHGRQHQVSMGEESPRLSTDSSLSGHDPVQADCCSLSIEHSDNERPMSTVSTISSGSSGEGQSSLFSASHCLQSLPSLSTETDINLELSPPEEPNEYPFLLRPASKRLKQDPAAGQFNNNANTIEALPPRLNGPTPVASVVMAPNSQLTYVDRVVMEIIETERMYVRDLRSIVKDYLAHIIDTRDLPIKPEQVCSLFGNIEVIYELNSELLQTLEMCDSDPVAIACCFVEKEIAKHFDPEEEGYDVVEEAIVTMTGVAWYINDMKRKHEHAVRLQEIQSLLINWKGPDLTAYGELVLEGTFHVHRAKNERTLFLFDKMLLITKKRGEHYVYKTHIMCSTLMLIESAKDSFRFSVTHYKHPKQPHTVQAKTVEEKKLWAHHIKRLILENHHVIIPQTAKDVILDMRSAVIGFFCNYRSCFTISSNNRACSNSFLCTTVYNCIFTLQHADSVGTLLSASSQGSLQAAVSASTLGSGTDEAETERPVNEESTTGWLSLDWLSMTGFETPFQREKEEQKEEKGQSGKDEEVLVKDEQVADFASSVLAAISCWRYKARALLFARVPMNRVGEQAMEEKLVESKRSQSAVEGDQSENSAVCEEECSEDHCSPEVSLPAEEEEENEEEEEEERAQQSHIISQDESRVDEEIVEVTIESLSQAHNEIQLEDESNHSRTNFSEDVEDLGDDEDEIDDDEDEEEVSSRTESKSILPTSVLDKASVIVEHFVSSLSRQSSVAVDDMLSLGCSSSQTGSRRSSVFSLNAELLDKEKTQEISCSSPEPVTFQLVPESFASATLGDRLVTPDQRAQTKPDTLSKKDRMLIHKIKQYYEHAEEQDENFSIKRRESLSYIPAGLVRDLSRQLNGLPTEEAAASHKKASKVTRPTSWSVFELPGLEKEKNSTEVMETEILSSIDTQKDMERSQVVAQTTDKEEDFQTSSVMIKVWQDMEVEINETSTKPQNAFKDNINSIDVSPTQDQMGQERSYCDICEPLQITEESDSMAGQGTSMPSPLIGFQGKEHTGDSLYSDEIQKRQIKHAPLPKIVSLRSGSEDDLMIQDMEKMKNKVFQLARQYSQRIKNNRPVVRQREKVSDINFCHKNLSSVVEDKTQENEMGMQSPALSLVSCEHENSSSSLSPCSLGSPQLQSTIRQHTLDQQSPVYTESFNWPDVRELRSKYSRPSPQLVSINRSCSVPEQILEVGRNNPIAHQSCSCSSPVNDPHTTQIKDTSTTHSMDKGPAGQGVGKLRKSSSLDHVVGPLHLKQQTNLADIQMNYYISGQATLPNENKIIIVERITKMENNGLGADEEKKYELHKDQLRCPDSAETSMPGSFEKAENSQHSSVKNLREKFQNLGSYT
ncbi:pleckstrin-like domain-containing family G member 3-like [Silurus meridionalis]|nr:pleckstrin-like domain-containing family G member 3-like [Silurus meridionalis]